MKKWMFLLITFCIVGMAGAELAITNGDFEAQTGSANFADVADWYDYAGSSFAMGPWVRTNGSATINPSNVCFMSGAAGNSDEDGGDNYIWQSIGIADGTLSLDISFDWGLAGDQNSRDLGVTLMILESDGTFVAPATDDGETDIYDVATGVTELSRATRIQPSAVPGASMSETFTLDLTKATIGNELFLRANTYGDEAPWSSMDNFTLVPTRIANVSPANNAKFVAIERTSPENDLVFAVVDPNFTAVDVLFGPENDPNLSSKPEYKIVDGMSVLPGNQYTVTLETELAADLKNGTDYYWKVLAYEPNAVGGGLAHTFTGLVWSFTTIAVSPELSAVSPSVIAVFPGEDAVFSVTSVQADTYQWYKEGEADPLEDGSMYSGVDTTELTVLDAQLADEGYYYCVGTDTDSGLDGTSEPFGQLIIKDLRSYYPFDTTYEDGGAIYTPDTKGGKNAQLMGGATVDDANSIVGNYLHLDNGTSDSQYARITDITVADYADITISAWVYPVTLDSLARVWEIGEDGSNYMFLTVRYRQNDPAHDGLDVARAQFQITGESEDEIDGVGQIDAGEWIFVVITIEDNVGKIYLNGEYSEDENMNGNLTDITKTFNYIGRDIASSEPYFNGFIDELKIYNYARTTEEIARDYMDVRDDIAFICNMETYALGVYDINGDCQVDLGDFAEIAAQWLNNDRIYAD